MFRRNIQAQSSEFEIGGSTHVQTGDNDLPRSTFPNPEIRDCNLPD